MRVKTLGLMLIGVLALTFGDISLALAMRDIGEVNLADWRSLGGVLAKMFTPPGIWLGLLLMATFFFLWLLVLSFADLSFALPLTALTYVFTGLLVGPMLGEEVSPQRWLGMILITAGVVVISLTEPAKPSPPE